MRQGRSISFDHYYQAETEPNLHLCCQDRNPQFQVEKEAETVVHETIINDNNLC